MQSKTLHQACQVFAGDQTVITAMLEKNTDQLNSLNDAGYNPLHLLFVHGLKNGASADQVLAAVKLLIDKGANPHAVDMRGRNLLHLAVEFNHRQVDNQQFEPLVGKLIEDYPKMLDAVDKQGNTVGHLMIRQHYSKNPQVSGELFKQLCPETCRHQKNKHGMTPYDLVFVYSPAKTTLGTTKCTPELLEEMAKNGVNAENFIAVLEAQEQKYPLLGLINLVVDNKNLKNILIELVAEYASLQPAQAIDDLWEMAENNDVVIHALILSYLNLKNSDALADLAQRCSLSKSTQRAKCYVAVIISYFQQENYSEDDKLLALVNKLTKLDHEIFAQVNNDAYDTIDVFLRDCNDSILGDVIKGMRLQRKQQLASAEQCFIKAVKCTLNPRQAESLILLKTFALHRLGNYHQSFAAREFVLNSYLNNGMEDAAIHWLRNLPNKKDPEVMRQLSDICIKYNRLDISIIVIGFAPACFTFAEQSQEEEEKFELYCRAIELAPKDKEVVNKALALLSAIKISDGERFYTLATAIIAVIEGKNYDDSVLRKSFSPFLLPLFTKAAIQTAEERSSIGNWFSSPSLCTQYAKAFLCLLSDSRYETRCRYIKDEGMSLGKDTILFYQSLQSDDSALAEVGLADKELVARAANILSLLNPCTVARALTNK